MVFAPLPQASQAQTIARWLVGALIIAATSIGDLAVAERARRQSAAALFAER